MLRLAALCRDELGEKAMIPRRKCRESGSLRQLANYKV